MTHDSTATPRPVRLHVSHSWGGGIARWLADFARADAGHTNLLLRSVGDRNQAADSLELVTPDDVNRPLLRWPLPAPIAATVVTDAAYRTILDDVISLLGVRQILVSSLIGHSLDVLDTGLPTVVVQHDFYPFCPALFIHFGAVCTRCDAGRLTDCLQHNEHNVFWHSAAAADWLSLRPAFAARLAQPHVRWVAPSASVHRHLGQLDAELAALPCRIIEHGLDAALFPRRPLPLPSTGKLRLLVPGRLAPHKGQALLLEALPLLRPHAELILAGAGRFGDALAGEPGVTIIPDYRLDELGSLLDTVRPDAALLLSIVPETFSYTLSEFRALGVPPIATRIGAFADRIRDGEDGWLAEPSATDLAEVVADLAANRARIAAVAAHLAVQPLRSTADMVRDYDALVPLPERCDPPAVALALRLVTELAASRSAELAARAEATAQQGHRDYADEARRQAQADVERIRQALTAAERAAARASESYRIAVHQRQQVEEAMRAAVDTLHEIADFQRHELTALRNSTSWKLTAPLRTAITLLRQLRPSPGSLLGLPQRWRELMAAERQAEPPVAEIQVPGASPTSQPAGVQERYISHVLANPVGSRGHFVDERNGAAVASRLRAIAFYLPQYHPIPENDVWWGRGFTEWTNVSRAVPQFPGHYQPRLPGELGFYDLRLPEVQARQVELAKRYGLSGFCFYYYWFSGRRLLERPLEQYLAHPEFDLPFCVCWANENWTRRWDGRDDEVLMRQLYREEDEAAFIEALLPLFRDPRYIRVDGRPVLLVYRADVLPDAQRAVRTWRKTCHAAGVGDPLLLMVQFGASDPRPFAFDGAVEFPPHVPHVRLDPAAMEVVNPNYEGIICDYGAVAEEVCQREAPDYPWFRGIMPSWDNEARRPGRGTVFHGSTPELYSRWLRHVAEDTDTRHAGEEKLFFINAWNEWGEGTYLEPDRRWGYAYLEATAGVLADFPSHPRRGIAIFLPDAQAGGNALFGLALARGLTDELDCEVHVLLGADGPLRADLAAVAAVHDWHALVPEARHDSARQLYVHGVTEAFCLTGAAGPTASILAAAGLRCVGLVRELPGYDAAMDEGAAALVDAAATLVFPSQWLADQFAANHPAAAGKTFVRQPPAISGPLADAARAEARAALRARHQLADRTRLVLGVGRADARKGIDLFAQAAGIACRDRHDIRFVWLGSQDDGEMARHARLIGPLVANGQLIFAGQADAGPYLAAADLFVSSSRQDPCPNALFEAIAAGLPVVTFDLGGYAEWLTDDLADRVPPGDVEALAQAVVNRLDAGESERRQRAASARTYADQRLQASDYCRDLLDPVGQSRGETP
jgi:glycosyltransferase involved in cell wall biosynthesis